MSNNMHHDHMSHMEHNHMSHMEHDHISHIQHQMIGMNMQMTFSSLNQYKLTIFFEQWNITEVWQFFLFWTCTCLGAILFHYLKYCIYKIECSFQTERKNGITTYSEIDDLESNNRKYRKISLVDSFNLRILHSALMASNYFLSLLLMLIAMTYNSMLFIALIIGYFMGDYLFYIYYPQKLHFSTNVDLDCH